MKNFYSNLKYILPLFFLSVLVFGLTYAHQGNIVIDCGREVFYPKRILEGAVLYKDLFNIYGPFAYLYNAFLFKIFGINLNVLYISGILTATGIISFVFLISRLFFDKLLSTSITVLTLILGCFSFYIFNYIFPYSFSMTYGLLAVLASVYFLLLFVRNNNTLLYLANAFFAGLAVSNKYEFIPYCLIFIYLTFKNKISVKQNLLALITFAIAPCVTFGYLFHQGLSIHDFVHNLKDIYAMSQTVTLNYFYTISGLIFKKQTLGILIRNFLITLFPLALIYYSFKTLSTNKIKAGIAFAISVILAFKIASLETFIFLPFLLLILFCIFYKKLSDEKKILIISALLISVKVFWATALSSYGVYFIPLLLIALITLAKKDYYKQISVYLILLSIAFFVFFLPDRKNIKTPVKTQNGMIYVDKTYGETSNNIIKFINEKTNAHDKILILPEGLFFNYLTNRRSDDYYNSYLPLYVETFGEDRLIKNLKNDMPTYIILHNIPTGNYYFKSICLDYGFDVCNFIKDKYSPKALSNADFTAYIFEKK